MKSVIASLIASTCILTARPPDAYNITWGTPSQDSLDSMPLSGRLGAGANVWVQDGSMNSKSSRLCRNETKRMSKETFEPRIVVEFHQKHKLRN